MRIIVKLLFGLMLSCTFVMPGFGTELPKSVIEYIKQNFPNTNIRFDGLVELPDGTVYLPVLPLNLVNIDKPAEVAKTIPENQTFLSKPDLLLFNNNLSLLKIIKRNGESDTLIDSDSIPLVVKTGLLPQDLIVPDNLVIPAELKIILGDLRIPVKDVEETINLEKHKKSDKLNEFSLEYKSLLNKIFFVTNSRLSQISVISPETGRPIKIIKLSSVPSKIIATHDSRYLMALCTSSNKIAVIDAVKGILVKEIKLDGFPVSIIITPENDKAYVSCGSSSSVAEIDLKTMEIDEKFSVTGIPANLVMSGESKFLFYNDSATGKVYKIDVQNGNKITQIAEAKNISKLYQLDNYLYILSRTDDNLSIYDIENNKIVKKVALSSKPVDIKASKNLDRLYILSAGSACINVLNVHTFAIVRTIALKDGGFPRNMVVLNEENKALITNAENNELGVIDLDEEKFIGYIPINQISEDLIILKSN